MTNPERLVIWPTCAREGCINPPMRGKKQPYCLVCHASYQRAWWHNLKLEETKDE